MDKQQGPTGEHKVRSSTPCEKTIVKMNMKKDVYLCITASPYFFHFPVYRVKKPPHILNHVFVLPFHLLALITIWFSGHCLALKVS